MSRNVKSIFVPLWGAKLGTLQTTLPLCQMVPAVSEGGGRETVLVCFPVSLPCYQSPSGAFSPGCCWLADLTVGEQTSLCSVRSICSSWLVQPPPRSPIQLHGLLLSFYSTSSSPVVSTAKVQIKLLQISTFPDSFLLSQSLGVASWSYFLYDTLGFPFLPFLFFNIWLIILYVTLVLEKWMGHFPSLDSSWHSAFFFSCKRSTSSIYWRVDTVTATYNLCKTYIWYTTISKSFIYFKGMTFVTEAPGCMIWKLFVVYLLRILHISSSLKGFYRMSLLINLFIQSIRYMYYQKSMSYLNIQLWSIQIILYILVINIGKH